MTKIISGSVFAEQEFQLLIDNVEAVLAHEREILATPEYFFCEVGLCSCAWLYVGG